MDKVQKMRYRELIKIPDGLTLFNALLGILSIFFSIERNFTFAAIMLFGAVVFDFLDGKVARLMKRQGEFGKQLDSLCDMISFGVAPAVFVFMLEGSEPFNIFVLLFFVAAGALRLARFNISEMKGYYSGLPITNAGWMIPVWHLMGLPYIILLALVIAVLFISPIKVKKIL